MRQFDCLEVAHENDVAVVTFVDDKVMDVNRIQMLNDELSWLTEQDSVSKLLINLNNVRFLSSAAINKMIVLDKRMKEKGGQIRLCCLRPEVRDVFEITNLNTVFKIFDEQSDAIKSLEKLPAE